MNEKRVDKGDYVTLASEEGQANFIKPANNDSWMEGLFIKVEGGKKRWLNTVKSRL